MLKLLKSVISKSDVVMEVLDSREPELTRSRRIEEMILRSGKELLLVINKADLVPLEILKGWKEYFEDRVFALCSYPQGNTKGPKF